MKTTVVICFVLYALEVGAFPSVGTKTLTGEELNHMIQVTVAQTLKDLLTTTTTLAPVSTEETASVAPPPWQLSASQNLTNSIEELVKSLKDLTALSTTSTQASAYDERFKSIEQDLKNLTKAVEQLIVTAPKTSCGSDSGYEYWPVTKSCYKLHNESLGWSAADKACHDEGAYLAVINSHNEQQHLIYISQNTSNIFVGVYRDNAGQWRTVTGETVGAAAGYYMWATNEPYTGATWVFASVNNLGHLISRTEDSKFPFVCEKASSSAQIVF